MRTLPLLATLAILAATGCSWDGPPAARSELDPSAGLPPSLLDGEPRVSLPYGAQGPVVARSVPSRFAPPVGQCRIWLPGVAPVDQPDPALCSRARGHVPLGALLVHTPAQGIIEITTYDDQTPDLIVGITQYDAATGDPLLVPLADPER